MKKILSLLIIICVSILSFSFPVYADESSNNEIISNIQMLDLEEEGLINAFTFYSELDSKTYLVKTYTDHVNVYNNEDESLFNSLLVSSEISEVNYNNINSFNSAVLRLGPDDYELWGNWVYYKTDDMHIGDLTGWTISTLAGALTGAFGAFLGPLTGLATIIYNNQYESVYAKIYISTNTYCPILVKEKYEFYDNSTDAFVKTEEKSHSWWGQRMIIRNLLLVECWLKDTKI